MGFLRSGRSRALFFQIVALAGVFAALAFIVHNTMLNLERSNIASGFAFLGREAGFEIGESPFIAYSAADNYGRALLVGMFNTIRIALIGVVLATILGTLVGLARLSTNWLLAQIASAYLEVIRNVPLLVQLFLWYVLITDNLPGPRDALNPLPGVFLSNRGFAVPGVDSHPAHLWMLFALVAGLVLAGFVARWARARQARTGQPFPSFWAGCGIALGLPLAVFLAAGAPVKLDAPQLSGFNFQGGVVLTPEYATLLIGLVIYTAAFIGEIVRAGILAVHRGQFEAANALGLSRQLALRLVVMPQALRVIIPPLTSQYLNLTKNSSLAVAIGYPDLVSIANTSINQNGQAIEGIAIIMAAYLTVSLSISAFMNWYNKRIALVER
jgi:general L-amino acid transport system permease protein